MFIIGSLLWGSVLGFIYFGGLWLTVRRLATVKHQAILMLGSFVVRNALMVIGFLPVIKQGWQYALICLAGFTVVRFIMIRRINVRPC
jgi:F1F0 ATPase subunit 2